MIKTLLASAVIMFAIASTSYASFPATEKVDGFKASSQTYDLETKRRKPRVPGGSGCDTPRDVAEHPECTPAVKKADGMVFDGVRLLQEAKRRKPRVPGGSGCDTPRDVAEHPECRPAVKKA